MPRPKSALTGQKGFVGARLTEEQREAFYKLGGAKWLRAYLNNVINKGKTNAPTDATGTASVVAVHPPGPKPVPEKPKTIWQQLIRD